MGLFTNTEYDNLDIPVVEGYDGIDGRLNMMIESCHDDMEFFKSLVQYDVAEINAMREGTDLEALAENAITDAFGKLKDMIKKVWAKIKSLMEAFIARVTGFVAKDGKAYDKKYRTLALKNIGEGRCSKIKYKARRKKGASMSLASIPAAANSVDAGHSLVKDVVNDKKDNTEVKEALISNHFGISNADIKTFKKDLMDKYFEDEEEFEGIKSEDITSASQVLNGNSDAVKALDKEKKDIEKAFKDMLKKCDDWQKNMDTYLNAKEGDDVTRRYSLHGSSGRDGVAPDMHLKREDDETAAKKYTTRTKRISACRTVLTCFQEVATTAIGAKSEMISLEFKQARKVMALAASAAGRKKVNESVEDELAVDFILSEEAAFAVDAFMA